MIRNKGLPSWVIKNLTPNRWSVYINYSFRLYSLLWFFSVADYVTDILDDAKVYSQHANKKNLDADDVKLAVQCRTERSFTNPPPRDVSPICNACIAKLVWFCCLCVSVGEGERGLLGWICWFCVSVFLFSFVFLVLGAVGVGRFVGRWGGGLLQVKLCVCCD